jgi:hypothetical protein
LEASRSGPSDFGKSYWAERGTAHVDGSVQYYGLRGRFVAFDLGGDPEDFLRPLWRYSLCVFLAPFLKEF